MTVGLCSTQFWTAQIPAAQGITNPEDAALALSGSQGFLVLIAGIVLAFAFQLLLANFFIALGISYPDSEEQSGTDSEESTSLDEKITNIGTIVGLRALGTFTITLFTACFLAVKISPVSDTVLGAILGLVIWAAYFSVLIWVSLTTVGSLIGTVLNKVIGLQGILGTAAIAFGAKTASDQVVSTAEAAAATVRRELSTAADINSSRTAIDNYLKQLQLPEEDRQEIEAEFDKLIAEPEMKAISRENHLQNIGRQTFVDVVSSRTDVSKENINQAVNQFEAFWQQIWGKQPQNDTSAGLINYLLPAQPEESKTIKLSTKLEQLIEETRLLQAQQQAEAAQKVAETAAWWLFGTAFTSAAASAIAGSIAVTG